MYPFIIVATIVGLDQIIKAFILKNIVPVEQITIINHFLSLVYVENYGVAFGMFKNNVTFFIITTALIACFLIFMLIKLRGKSLHLNICISSILGGAIGNLIDRVRLGFVVDYISFSFFPPVFNLADSAIVVGAFFMAVIVIFDKNLEI